jgi:DNA modification methylase
MNHLYYGDNLTRMQQMGKHSVDLIYLDPPFNSKQNYNLIYKNMTGKPVPDQADAFCDTWEMDSQKEEIAKTMPILMREHGVEDYYVEFWRLWINALRHTQPHLLAYLIYMVQRLLYMKSILRPTGSIYLHCDPTASHYIKVMMDGIFGHRNFRNEIIWQRTGAHNDANRFWRVTDTILFYTVSDSYYFQPQHTIYDQSYVNKRYRYRNDSGRLFWPNTMTAAGQGPSRLFRGVEMSPPPNTHWRFSQSEIDRHEREGRIYYSKNGIPYVKSFLDERKGRPIQNLWTDIVMSKSGSERLGYPTQKPIALLDRIILSSSKPDSVVFDPFCGCGTTVYSAVKNSRHWIGCDVAILAVKLIRETLTSDKYRLVEGHDFDVDGIPVSVEQAEELFQRDPFQFEHWLVERVGGFPTKKTGDKGVDGRMYFETKEGLKCMVLSVKGGGIRPTDLRDLRGVLSRDHDMTMAGFLSLKPPSKAMWEEAATAGQFEYGGVKYNRMQLLTVKEILEEKREFHTPTKMVSRISTAQGSLAL